MTQPQTGKGSAKAIKGQGNLAEMTPGTVTPMAQEPSGQDFKTSLQQGQQKGIHQRNHHHEFKAVML